MRAFAEYIIRDRKNAILAALLSAFLPLCGWLSLSIIALVTLRKGYIEGLIILIWTSLPWVIFAFLGKPAPFINDVLLGSLTLWGMASLLRSNYSWSTVLQITTACTAAIVVIGLTVYPALPTWWEQQFNHLFSKYNIAAWDLGIPETTLKKLIHDISDIATGIYSALILTSNIISLFFARWMQSLLYHSGGFKREFYHIRLNTVASFILLITLIGVTYNIGVAANLSFIFIIPFLIAGISLFHRLTLNLEKQTIWLTGFYITLILFFPYTLLLLILGAFVDSGINIMKQKELKRQNIS
ncbi:MAG: hypothetical protein LEGION0398_MBIBDBAK_00039 [Legionellaceae bacterium]